MENDTDKPTFVAEDEIKMLQHKQSTFENNQKTFET